MTRMEMILKVRELYGADSEITKEFEEMINDPSFKRRHLETLIKCHEWKVKNQR